MRRNHTQLLGEAVKQAHGCVLPVSTNQTFPEGGDDTPRERRSELVHVWHCASSRATSLFVCLAVAACLMRESTVIISTSHDEYCAGTTFKPAGHVYSGSSRYSAHSSLTFRTECFLAQHCPPSVVVNVLDNDSPCFCAQAWATERGTNTVNSRPTIYRSHNTAHDRHISTLRICSTLVSTGTPHICTFSWRCH